MANEYLYSGAGDITTSQMLAAEWLLLEAEREALPNHGALHYAGDAAAKGSRTWQVSFLGLEGYDRLSAATEGTGISNTALSDGSATIAVGSYMKQYEVGDIARAVRPDILQVATFVRDAFAARNLTLTELIATLVDDFSNTIGTSGVDLVVSLLIDAVTALRIGNVPGPYMGILHPRQVGDLDIDLGTNTGGSLQWSQNTADFVEFKGPGYLGRLLNVDWFQSTFVPTANAGADRAGGVFGKGAIGWADMTPALTGIPGTEYLVGKTVLELKRTASAQLLAYVVRAYLGVTELDDDRGRTIISDA